MRATAPPQPLCLAHALRSLPSLPPSLPPSSMSRRLASLQDLLVLDMLESVQLNPSTPHSPPTLLTHCPTSLPQFLPFPCPPCPGFWHHCKACCWRVCSFTPTLPQPSRGRGTGTPCCEPEVAVQAALCAAGHRHGCQGGQPAGCGCRVARGAGQKQERHRPLPGACAVTVCRTVCCKRPEPAEGCT